MQRGELDPKLVFTSLVGMVGAPMVRLAIRQTTGLLLLPPEAEGFLVTSQEGEPPFTMAFRAETIDFSVGDKGPFRLAIDEALGLLPSEQN